MEDFLVYELSDTGNAERFIANYGEYIRYNVDNKYWMVFDGKTWVRDNKQLVKVKADELIKVMKNEIINGKEVERNYRHLSSSGGKDAMLKEAMHIGDTPTINNDFDTQNELLNCENGVVNLFTGEILPHDHTLLMAKNTHTICDMEHEPKRWIQFLNEIFNNDAQLVNFIHKAIGYTLTGYTKENCFFQCFGDGSNGKSLFFNIISKMMGDYALTVKAESILTSKTTNGSNASPDIARMNKIRFIRCNEPNENAVLNEGLVKQIVSGDLTTARFLFGNDFEFRPILKLWVLTNHKLKVRGTDKGIWRRQRIVPFLQIFEGANDDKNLEDTLLQELPQILGWAVKGCIAWYNEGLPNPDSVVEQTNEYKKENDLLSIFIEENCTLGDNLKQQSSELYNEYAKWCKVGNEYCMNKTKFGIEIAKKYTKQKLSGYIYYKGITLKKNDESYTFNKEDLNG